MAMSDLRKLLALVFLCSAAAPVWAEFEARAVVKAVNKAEIASALAGRVSRLPFALGDAFEKGDLLIGIDCELYQARASKVAIDVEAARARREGALAESDYARLKAELAAAQTHTRRCEISAPWPGRVAAVAVSRYEHVAQQQPVMTILDDSQLEAEVVVPASWLAWLRSGHSLRLRVDGLEDTIEAQVAAISPAIDGASQTAVIRTNTLRDTPLLPGIAATAVFEMPLNEAQR